jgi:hypothetical protein
MRIINLTGNSPCFYWLKTPLCLFPRQKVSNKLFSHLHFCQAGVEQRLRERRGSCITEKEGQKARLKPYPTREENP